MDKKHVYDSIREYSSLLKKYFDGQLSTDERKQLAHWLWKDRENRELLRRLRFSKSIKAYYQVYHTIDPEEEYRQLVIRYPQLHDRKMYWVFFRRSIAAAVFLLVSLATWFLFRTTTPELETPLATDEGYVAILTTSGGEVFRLGEQGTNLEELQREGLQFADSVNELTCTTIEETDTMAYHQLEIPRGGEYKLTLADGTKVWLNSESLIRFPLRFGQQHREIEIRGEVYLEVKKDASRPFRVIAGEGKVEVLGTSFGMNVYPEEYTWKTTLVEGSVKVSVHGQKLLLKPGKMAYLQDGKLRETTADTEKELAWTRGIFVFEHDVLEEVVKKLERWYNVEFRFENEKLKQYVFTGQVSRDRGIDQILDLIEKMDVLSFEKKADYFFIKEKVGDY